MKTTGPAQKYGTTADDRALAARMLELRTKAVAKNIPGYSDFLSPAERSLLLGMRELREGVTLLFDGGYADAERTRAVLVPADCVCDPEVPITALGIETKGPALSHRDILGAVMALGIRREKTGDILAGGRVPVLLCDSVIATYILQHLERAGRNRVTAHTVSLSEIPRTDYEQKSYAVQSMRLDSIVAGAFGLSRTDAADAVKAGLVFLNWRACLTAGQEVREGDHITLRGKGRARISAIGGLSRKGRIFVTIERPV